MSEDLLKRLRIIVIEFHNLHQLFNCNSFTFQTRAIQKLLKYHRIVACEANINSETIEVNGAGIPRILEVTFYRKDRSKAD